MPGVLFQKGSYYVFGELMDIVSSPISKVKRTETRLRKTDGGAKQILYFVTCSFSKKRKFINGFQTVSLDDATYSGSQGQLWITGPDLERRNLTMPSLAASSSGRRRFTVD